MTSRRVAARYAEALFGLAQAHASVETVRAELQALVGLIAQTPALASLLERPDLEAERKLAAATAALEGQFDRDRDLPARRPAAASARRPSGGGGGGLRRNGR